MAERCVFNNGLNLESWNLAKSYILVQAVISLRLGADAWMCIARQNVVQMHGSVSSDYTWI